MGHDDLKAAVGRLAEAAEHDVRTALGDDAARQVRAAADGARDIVNGTDAALMVASATDGRTDPHGWVRAPDGALRKVDGFGPEHDHTLVGVQPLAWDVAGTIVSWQLDAESRRSFLGRLTSAHPDLALADWVRFHEIARAALDLAQLTMSAPAGSDGDDARHALALDRSTRHLALVIGQLGDGSGS